MALPQRNPKGRVAVLMQPRFRGQNSGQWTNICTQFSGGETNRDRGSGAHFMIYGIVPGLFLSNIFCQIGETGILLKHSQGAINEVTIVGGTIDGTGGASIQTDPINPPPIKSLSNQFSVSGMRLSSEQYGIIWSEPFNNLKVTGCTIHCENKEPITLTATRNCLLVGNTIFLQQRDPQKARPTRQALLLQSSPSKQGNRNCVIQGNVIGFDENGDDPGRLGPANSILADDGKHEYIKIRNNRIAKWGGRGGIEWHGPLENNVVSEKDNDVDEFPGRSS